MAWPARVLPHEQAVADLAAGDVDLAEMLAELPALTDVLEDEPSPEALAAALAHAPDIEPEPETDVVADPEQPLADAEEGESLAGWLAERPLGEETKPGWPPSSASWLSMPKSCPKTTTGHNCRWKSWPGWPRRPLLATPEPTPKSSSLPPCAGCGDPLACRQEAAFAAGFDVLPELGSTDEPAPLATSDAEPARPQPRWTMLLSLPEA